ncbi:MAG: glutathione S-transferase [Burkholderiales bacterium]|nr:MAG: glutathione S-transferase [Burkholderiales bacterium]
MTRPLLYTYRRCPYAMRARMALIVSGIAFDAYEISLRDKPAAMLAASPKGTVPVLVLTSGEVLEESLQIMRWAFEQGFEPWWVGAQTPSNQALIALNDGAFKQQLDRYKYPERYVASEREMHRDQAVRGLLQKLEQRLAADAYLGDATACAADLAIFPFVRQFRAVDEAWFDAQALPATQKWLQNWLQSELFEQCMKKLPTNQHVIFSS